MKQRGMNMRNGKAIVVVTLALASALAFSLNAQSPMINYQGKVTDSDGVPLDGTYSMQYCIYPQETGGTALWCETQSSVNVEKGIFNVLLGSVTSYPSNVFNGDARWLGVKVGTDPEMSRRQQIVSVGYALRADKANEADDSDKLDNHDSNYFATADHTHTGADIEDGTIEEEDLSFPIPDGHSLDAADGIPTDAVYVDDDGKVGIGTTTPAKMLHAYCPQNENTRDRFHVGDGTYGLFMGGATNTGFLPSIYGRAYDNDDWGIELVGAIEPADDTGTIPAVFINGRQNDGTPLVNRPILQIGNVTSPKITVDKDGNVGIGTTGPSYRLDVTSNANVGAARFTTQAVAGGQATLTVDQQDVDEWAMRVTSEGNGPVFSNNGPGTTFRVNDTGTTSTGDSTPFIIDTDGNVGIGTQSPSEELHVVGDIYCTGKLTSDGGNDPPYVLYNKETRESIKKRVAEEVPSEKKDGAVLFWNGEDLRFEVYLPERGEFRDLMGNVLETVEMSKVD